MSDHFTPFARPTCHSKPDPACTDAMLASARMMMFVMSIGVMAVASAGMIAINRLVEIDHAIAISNP
jgi:hypothetical protein